MLDSIDSPQFKKKRLKLTTGSLLTKLHESNERTLSKSKHHPGSGNRKSDYLYSSAAADAIRCQAMILEFFTCLKFDYEALIDYAADSDWCRADGTACIQNAGKLLEYIGINVNRYEYPSAYELTHELTLGHKVILGVKPAQTLPTLLTSYNHIIPKLRQPSVFVAGIDTRCAQEMRVMLHDPVNKSTVITYPFKEFVFNWRKTNFFMLGTKKIAPMWLPEMANFDYGLGHTKDVLAISYQRFRAFQKRPEAWCDKMFGLSATTISSIDKYLSEIENVARNDRDWNDRPSLDENNVIKHP